MQERAGQTRELLLRAAAEAFDELGYAGTSVSKILERAGLTAGAMYFHFASKEELARAVVLEQAADVRFPDEGDGLQRLVNLTQHLAVEMQRNTLLRAGVRLAVDQSAAGFEDYAIYEWWTEQFRRRLVRTRELGELLPGVDEGEFAEQLVAGYTGSQIMSRISSGRADLPQRIATLWRYLLPAIDPPDVIRRVDLSPARREDVP
ncbi:ScbR family autoregulator-binding transcription factor [Streptomyces alkaliphilus]|uniref:ScbR family autoregulator-binding transcription factor n=1 Tax=Streptomyces alkaliphilus TaxID=1472722 RepID=UPI001180F3A2|nr:ScbR family autoregulator-binding transcription factor [Streptomyces alkaliphilus]MQS06051.1 TetR family transcriptional regulator [Streptomyces alkaliphilus]